MFHDFACIFSSHSFGSLFQTLFRPKIRKKNTIVYLYEKNISIHKLGLEPSEPGRAGGRAGGRETGRAGGGLVGHYRRQTKSSVVGKAPGGRVRVGGIDGGRREFLSPTGTKRGFVVRVLQEWGALAAPLLLGKESS